MIKEFKEFIKLAKRFRELDLDELKRFCHLQVEIENALGRLENYEQNEDFSKDVLNYAFLNEQDKIKKLKALELIKENLVVSYDESKNDMPCLVIGFKIDKDKMAIIYHTFDKDKIDLLKEVFKDELRK